MYSPQKAADIASVSRTTIMTAINAGDLQSSKNNRGHHRIDAEELRRWMDGRADRRSAEPFTDRDSETVTENVRLKEQLAASLKETDTLRQLLERERSDKDRLMDLLKEHQRRRSVWEILTGKPWGDS